MNIKTLDVAVKSDVHGILLLNKPKGLTSNAVLQRTKRLLGAKKAGHTGSLDPMATGMLPICFGEATKFCQYLLDADKCYEVTGRLGIKTDTGDADGVVLGTCSDFHISSDRLQQTLTQFLGPILQTPSMFSALKHQGLPLYKYARAGVTIERSPREVHIQTLELLSFDGVDFSLRVQCTKGTYMRSLVEDIGNALGVGAHVTRLHRCFTAGFHQERMWTLEELQGLMPTQILLSMERAIVHMPKLIIDVHMALALRQGKVVETSGLLSTSAGCVRLYEPDNTFIGLGDVSDTGLLKVRRLLSFEG